MKMILCLDECNGLLFHKRRLSSDSLLCQKILNITKDSKLWMNNYSGKLFGLQSTNICIDENFAMKAKKGEFCFFENQDVNEAATTAEEIYLFRWNRHYPSDVKFEQANLADRKLVFTDEFSGSSHDRISLEVYR